jgi:hypothetical protein
VNELEKIPDPTKPWDLTESDKRLLIACSDKWVKAVLNDVRVRQDAEEDRQRREQEFYNLRPDW